MDDSTTSEDDSSVTTLDPAPYEPSPYEVMVANKIARNQEELRKLGLTKSIGELAREKAEKVTPVWTLKAFEGHRAAPKKKGHWELWGKSECNASHKATYQYRWESMDLMKKEFPDLVAKYIEDNPEVGTVSKPQGRSTRSKAASQLKVPAGNPIASKAPATENAANNNPITSEAPASRKATKVPAGNPIASKAPAPENAANNNPIPSEAPASRKATKVPAGNTIASEAPAPENAANNNPIATKAPGGNETNQVASLRLEKAPPEENETNQIAANASTATDKGAPEPTTYTNDDQKVEAGGGCRFDHSRQEHFKEESNAAYAKTPYYLSGTKCAECNALVTHETNKTGETGEVFVKPTGKKPVWACRGVPERNCDHVLCTVCFGNLFLKEDSNRKPKRP